MVDMEKVGMATEGMEARVAWLGLEVQAVGSMEDKSMETEGHHTKEVVWAPGTPQERAGM